MKTKARLEAQTQTKITMLTLLYRALAKNSYGL